MDFTFEILHFVFKTMLPCFVRKTESSNSKLGAVLDKPEIKELKFMYEFCNKLPIMTLVAGLYYYFGLKQYTIGITFFLIVSCASLCKLLAFYVCYICKGPSLYEELAKNGLILVSLKILLNQGVRIFTDDLEHHKDQKRIKNRPKTDQKWTKTDQKQTKNRPKTDRKRTKNRSKTDLK